MTLHEWEAAHPRAYVGTHDSGARWVADTTTAMTYDDRRLLWRLDDYLVTSVIAGTIWLVHRRPGGVTS